MRQHVVSLAEAALRDLGVDAPSVELSRPPDPELGDWAFPCFVYARALRKPPPLIAADVASRLGPDALVEGVTAEKAYVNIRLRRGTLFAAVLGQVLGEGEGYGGGQADPPEHVMVEYSAPNTNKPLHLGHLRNNLIGFSVSEVLRFHGHEVTRVNLINDRGVHICKSMLAYQRWGEDRDPAAAGLKGDHWVGALYVLFDNKLSEEYAAWQQTAEAEEKLATWLESKPGLAAREKARKSPTAPPPDRVFFATYKDVYFNTESALGGGVRAMLRAWEEGDPEVLALWRRMNDWVLAGHDQTYRRMGVAFDHVQLESETYKLGKEVVAQGLRDGIFKRLDDGAVVVPAGSAGLKKDKVVLRSDGTSVYTTQDLGTALQRFDHFDIQRMVYVVGDEQRFHFEALFAILGLVRPGLAEACHHLAYGMIRLPEGKMKSREGTVVDADDLMDEVQRLAREETLKRAREGKAHTEGIDEQELALRAERIGMAALKYYLLKFTPKKSFEYHPKESIDFLGQTGPYCLFNYARTRSLLRRAGGSPPFDAAAAHRLGSPQEREVLRLLMAFPEAVARAADTLDPSRIAEHLFDLAKAFAVVFTDKCGHPIVTCHDEELRRARLMLAAAVGVVVKRGLSLLGIDALEEM